MQLTRIAQGGYVFEHTGTRLAELEVGRSVELNALPES